MLYKLKEHKLISFIIRDPVTLQETYKTPLFRKLRRLMDSNKSPTLLDSIASKWGDIV